MKRMRLVVVTLCVLAVATLLLFSGLARPANTTRAVAAAGQAGFSDQVQEILALKAQLLKLHDRSQTKKVLSRIGALEERMDSLLNELSSLARASEDQVAVPGPPTNDEFENATVIDPESLGITIEAVTNEATLAATDPIAPCNGIQNSNSVWFSFTPGESRVVTMNTCGSTYDTVLTVWRADRSKPAEAVACNDDALLSRPSCGSFDGLTSSLTFFAAAGQQYLVEVMSFGKPRGGKLRLNYVGCEAITCPANITKSNDPDKCGAFVTFAVPTDCIGTSCLPAPGSFFPVGMTTVTCTNIDGPTCTFTVTVNDTQPPTITCPANVTKCNDTGQCSALVTYPPPTASDNCPGVTTMCSPASNSTFQKGTTTVTCTATDASGNTATCTFTVTVNDCQPPTITCPPNQTVTATASCPLAANSVVTFPPAAASDNCPGVTVACNPSSGSTFAAGTTTVTCTATDTSGNTATCSFTVTVFSFCLQDETNPGNFVLINANTGEYRFFCNNVLIATGTGTLTTKVCIGSIEHQKGDRRVYMEWDTTGAGGKGAGTAIVQLSVNNTRCQITDKNMSNNTCAPTL